MAEEEELTDVTAEQYRALIKQTSDVITVVDAGGTIRYQSPSSEHVKGWSPSELVGENILEYVHPDDRVRVSEEFSALTEKRGTIEEEIEFRFRTKDEGWIWLAVTGTAPGPESPIDGYITTSRDITERKEYEREIESERNFLEEIIESLPYPFYVLDVEDYTIRHANSQATVTEGDTCYEVTHGRDQPCDQGEETAPCPINEIGVDEPVTVEHTHLDEDGDERIFELHAAPLSDEDGNPVQIAESNIDITERKEYERDLETQRDDLEVLNQVVRHDIRNELQLVSAYAETLRDQIEEDEEYVERILDAARDAVEITTTARDVTKIMLQSDVDRHPVRLRSTLENEIDDVRSSHQRAVVRTDGAIPDVEVRADDMLASVFRNVLKNAIQHNDKEIPEVTVTTTTEDGTVQVRIADNGPGISEERKVDVFERGEMGLDSEGTGLGLYLVATLVDRYGGDVRVGDNEPEGTVFVVELPVVE